jgi:hypothetical protein
MIQLTLSIFAWMGIVIVQFMVHCFCSRRMNRNNDLCDEEDKLLSFLEYDSSSFITQPLLDLEQQQHESATAMASTTTSIEDVVVGSSSNDLCNCNMDTATRFCIHHMRQSSNSNIIDVGLLENSNASQLDGDEPCLFFHLLEQTGSEMVLVSTTVGCW